MNDIHDVKNWFRSNRFVLNPLITIIVVGRYDAVKILAILIKYNKNESKRNFRSRSSYLNYLDE